MKETERILFLNIPGEILNISLRSLFLLIKNDREMVDKMVKSCFNNVYSVYIVYNVIIYYVLY